MASFLNTQMLNADHNNAYHRLMFALLEEAQKDYKVIPHDHQQHEVHSVEKTFTWPFNPQKTEREFKVELLVYNHGKYDVTIGRGSHFLVTLKNQIFGDGNSNSILRDLPIQQYRCTRDAWVMNVLYFTFKFTGPLVDKDGNDLQLA